MGHSARLVLVTVLIIVLSGCGGGGGGSVAWRGSSGSVPSPDDDGVIVTTVLSPDDVLALDALQAAIAATAGTTSEEFLAECALPFREGLSYDPLTADGLERIQGSSLALDAKELSALGEKGFAILDRHRFESFFRGLERIYVEDLPLYVSADTILHSIHRSYDEILKAVELSALIPDVRAMLEAMRESLKKGGASKYSAEARRDVDLYLSVALGLLTGKTAAPVAGGDGEEVEVLVGKAQAGSGTSRLTLFGVRRDVDFSQFKPRGHYTDHWQLRQYFRCMMWLGRIDLRILETMPDHSQVLRRRQLDSALLFRDLMDADTMARWQRIDTAIGTFIGESDNMMVTELSLLLADLGVKNAAGLGPLPDGVIAQAIVSGGYGTQRISSHIMINGTGEGTMPLSSTFLLLGQRYVIDSQVFSNVVYDRVGGGRTLRMMPDPLDVAYAVLRSDHAGAVLDPEIREHRYAPDLKAMRILADGHDDEFWESNLYNLWLGVLRELNPDPAAEGIPEVAATEPWARRLLNAQLASWAELRHDTILYAKQSYTGGASCEYPDVYVDPYPAFFAAVLRYAERGGALAETVEAGSTELATRIRAYFKALHDSISILLEMAEYQREGTPFTPEHMEFINRAVRLRPGACGMPDIPEGWYADLFFDPQASSEFDPTIADVHTQSTDEIGNMVGRVLHVATGHGRLLVVTIDTCDGPRAYVGLASSYFERITTGLKRLSDEDWLPKVVSGPEEVRWMKDLVVR